MYYNNSGALKPCPWGFGETLALYERCYPEIYERGDGSPLRHSGFGLR